MSYSSVRVKQQEAGFDPWGTPISHHIQVIRPAEFNRLWTILSREQYCLYCSHMEHTIYGKVSL